MTNEQLIERARLVKVFLESDEFKAAWSAVDSDLVRDFREAASSEQALAVHDEMRAMKRLMNRWTVMSADAAVAKHEIRERDRKRKWF